jgi:nucleotide-binding universal stress UspA family protein
MIAESTSKIALKNILFLTDFSEPSEAALPFAVTIARGYGAKVYTLNAFMPAPYAYTTPELSAAAMEAQEENAKAEMHRVEASFAGLPHESIIERGIGVWPAVQQATREHAIDLVVLGTHGRSQTLARIGCGRNLSTFAGAGSYDRTGRTERRAQRRAVPSRSLRDRP